MKKSIIFFFPFGSGFGNHGYAYHIFYDEVLSQFQMDDYKLNSEDAAGLLVRIFSETGVVIGGLFLLYYVWSIIRSVRLYRLAATSTRTIIYLSVCIGLGIVLLRHGNYLSVTTIFMLSVMILLNRMGKDEIINS